ncbi:hypothetical protein C8N43_3644 [Litoreibacter ponti]|uniref:Uncharacterized protein n=1 Tax=Litoreibacter ponti TaxID=1510457 RepID=A0A2T6BFI6_9RHOB|nr:hypothetical protein [Litoreibacter ponti]PTX54823.1 hypothetical protein C8N43_3644 [Litoreibacter ponti]
MKKFSLVSLADLSKINKNNLKTMTAERQVKAIRLWTDQNIRKYGPMGTQNSDAEMQTFLTEAAAYLDVDTTSALFKRAIAEQKGWGPAWRAKIVDRHGTVVDLDEEPSTSDDTLQTQLQRIVQDRDATGHGPVTLAGTAKETCTHWRSGDKRIFGKLSGKGTLTLIGIGRHTGTDNKNYKLDLIGGGSTTAKID